MLFAVHCILGNGVIAVRATPRQQFGSCAREHDVFCSAFLHLNKRSTTKEELEMLMGVKMVRWARRRRGDRLASRCQLSASVLSALVHGSRFEHMTHYLIIFERHRPAGCTHQPAPKYRLTSRGRRREPSRRRRGVGGGVLQLSPGNRGLKNCKHKVAQASVFGFSRQKSSTRVSTRVDNSPFNAIVPECIAQTKNASFP